MIYTITVNPAKDVCFYLERHLSPGFPTTITETFIHPGGGGVNISRVIANLFGHDKTIAICCLGGSTGKEIEKMLKKEEVQIRNIKISNPNRTNFMLISTEGHNLIQTPLPSQSPQVSGPEISKLREVIEKLPLKKEDYVIISGSLPKSPDFSYTNLITTIKLQNNAVKIALDTSSYKALENVMKIEGARANIIKLNAEEFGRLCGYEGEIKIFPLLLKEAREYFEQYRPDLKVLMISLGENGALLVDNPSSIKHAYLNVKRLEQDGHKLSFKSTLGAGDTLLGAYIGARAFSKLSKIEALKFAIAAATISISKPGTGLCSRQDKGMILLYMKYVDIMIYAV